MTLKDIMMLNLKDYFDTVLDVPINIILLGLTVALCIGSFAINAQKSSMLLLLRSLLRREAFDESRAKTLKELHLCEKRSVRSVIRKHPRLRRMIRIANSTDIAPQTSPQSKNTSPASSDEITETQTEYTEAAQSRAAESEKRIPYDDIDFDSARFYIPKEHVNEARRLEETENPTLLRTSLVAVFMIAIFFCLAMLMPDILNLLKNSIE